MKTNEYKKIILTFLEEELCNAISYMKHVTERSLHGSSQYAVAEDFQNTAMSVASVSEMPENVDVESVTSTSSMRMMLRSAMMVSSKSPNATFQRS